MNKVSKDRNWKLVTKEIISLRRKAQQDKPAEADRAAPTAADPPASADLLADVSPVWFSQMKNLYQKYLLAYETAQHDAGSNDNHSTA